MRVSIKFQQQSLRGPANRIRAIALVLLASLCWAATAELTHRHRSQSFGSFAELQESSTSNDQATPRIESTRNSGPSGTLLSSSECSICQLHQNLFASLFSHTLYVAPATTQLLRGPSEIISYFSDFRSPQQGRAPPFLL